MSQLRFFRWLLGFVVVLSGMGRLSAQGGESIMVVEAHSGRILLASESRAERPVASLTKIATAVVAIDWAEAAGVETANFMVAVPPAAAMLGGPNPMQLAPGEQMSLRDALFSAMLGSDNIAALAVADGVGRKLLERRGRGGDPVAEFVDEMNRLTKALGMRDTRFTNPHGLVAVPGKDHSSAADIAMLCIHAMRRPGFSFIVRQKQRQITVQSAAGSRGFKVINTNELLGETGITGIKTGTTAAAGPCLATNVERDALVQDQPNGPNNGKLVTPRRLIVVVLNSPDRFGRTRALVSQGWAKFDQWKAAGSPVGDARREFLVVPEVP